MIYIEAPHKDFIKTKSSLFLAGGITGCPDWQSKVVNELKGVEVIVFNPRRENFPINDPNAAFDQIKWEHDMFRQSDMLSFWFCAETMCPIVLYELGAWSMTEKPIVIGMDPKYPRRQDVEIQTKLVRPDIKIVYSIQEFINAILQMIKKNIKHTAKIQSEFLKYAFIKHAAGWDDLSFDAQSRYLREHPKSKRRLTKKSGESGEPVDRLEDYTHEKKLSFLKLSPKYYEGYHSKPRTDATGRKFIFHYIVNKKSGRIISAKQITDYSFGARSEVYRHDLEGENINHARDKTKTGDGEKAFDDHDSLNLKTGEEK